MSLVTSNELSVLIYLLLLIHCWQICLIKSSKEIWSLPLTDGVPFSVDQWLIKEINGLQAIWF